MCVCSVHFYILIFVCILLYIKYFLIEMRVEFDFRDRSGNSFCSGDIVISFSNNAHARAHASRHVIPYPARLRDSID